MAECIGIDEADIPDVTSLSLLDLDSLGLSELSEVLSNKFGPDMRSNSLSQSTLAGIQRLVSIQHQESISVVSKPFEIASDAPQDPVVIQFEASQSHAKLLQILVEVSGARSKKSNCR